MEQLDPYVGSFDSGDPTLAERSGKILGTSVASIDEELHIELSAFITTTHVDGRCNFERYEDCAK